jgi:hypothetical protein
LIFSDWFFMWLQLTGMKSFLCPPRRRQSCHSRPWVIALPWTKFIPLHRGFLSTATAWKPACALLSWCFQNDSEFWLAAIDHKM